MQESCQGQLAAFRSLHMAIRSCQRCKEIGKRTTNIQPPWDPERGRRRGQKWGMLIGQAPGAQEMEAALKRRKRRGPQKKIEKEARGGIAFIGPAGQRLRAWLEKAGFTEEDFRSRFYKTAVTKCYPGKTKSGDRRPGQREIELCRHFLEEEIRLVNPKVLIPMGISAIQWFFPRKSLNEVVGRKLKWRGRAVICLPHASPASAWWKDQENAVLVRRAISQLRKLRVK